MSDKTTTADRRITDADREHRLKTWPEFWEAMNSQGKTFEIRKDDRDYAVGDMLVLDEWNPSTPQFTGRRQFRCASFVASDTFCGAGNSDWNRVTFAWGYHDRSENHNSARDDPAHVIYDFKA